MGMPTIEFLGGPLRDTVTPMWLLGNPSVVDDLEEAKGRLVFLKDGLDTTHASARLVIVTISVPAVTDWIWFAITSVVFAPEQATKVKEVFGRC